MTEKLLGGGTTNKANRKVKNTWKKPVPAHMGIRKKEDERGEE